MNEKLISDNEKLIYFIANKFNSYKSKEDLYQAGILGLLKAKENYNESFNVKFSTYAFSFILGEMNKLVREDKGIKISRDISKLNSRIEKVYSILSQKLMKEPKISEIANFLNIPEYYVSLAILSKNKVRSLSEPINDEGRELTLEDVIGKSENIDDKVIVKVDEILNKGIRPDNDHSSGISFGRKYVGRKCITILQEG